MISFNDIQHKYSPASQWEKKLRYNYPTEHLSSIKKRKGGKPTDTQIGGRLKTYMQWQPI